MQIQTVTNSRSSVTIKAESQAPLNEAQLVELSTQAVKYVQYRKRERLLDEDDIGEFAQEVILVRDQGAKALVALMATPAKKANSYKGRCESTVLTWRINPSGQESIEAVRHEKMNKYRFRAFLPADHPAILFPDGFNGCKFNPHIPTGYKRQRSIEGFAVVR